MLATHQACYNSATFAGRGDAQCMSSSMPFMCMATAAGASFSILATDVHTSVSFIGVALFLALLGVLICLSGLTGRVVLVGLTKEMGTGVTQGD
jgi:hypothetical protein